MFNDQDSRLTPLIIVLVVSITLVGYFTGLQAPMSRSTAPMTAKENLHVPSKQGDRVSGVVLPSTRYSHMAVTTMNLSSPDRKAIDAKAIAEMIKRNEIESNRKMTSSVPDTAAQKETTLERRSRNRAYDGAPPTIPHKVDQRSTQACITCHGTGTVSASLRIPRIPHPYYTNCTQCHVENNPSPLVPKVFRESSFVGLSPPDHGPRAYPKAPPQIPHPTWMRNDCMSCHGPAGSVGMRTPHQERKNCQQCHAASAALEHQFFAAKTKFLPPPVVEDPKQESPEVP